MSQSGYENESLTLNRSELVSTEKEESAGAVSAMLNEVYEHPLRSAGIAAGVVAAGALLFASRGRIAENLARKPGVLVIEDSPAMGLALSDVLKGNGHKVTWIKGVKSLNPLTGISAEGKDIALTGSKRFQIALVDGDLGKNALTGPEIVGTLKQHRIMSIGTSTVSDFNTAMVANGAEIAANKAVVLSSLVGKKLDLKAALKVPEAAQASLDAFGGALRLPENQAIRKAADAVLMKYMSHGF